jgi:hypothetical protein
MTPRTNTALAVAFLVPLTLASGAQAVTFDDGLVHVIDAGNSYPFDLITVQDGPGSIPTTVNILSGGEVATQVVSGNSFISENSILNLSGGLIGSPNVPGTGSTFVWVNDQAMVNVTSGAMGQLRPTDASTVTVLGGELHSIAANEQAIVNVHGGLLDELHKRRDTDLNLSGSQVSKLLRVTETATSVMSGGSIGMIGHRFVWFGNGE